MSGAIYYLTNSNNRQHCQNYIYHTVSDIVSDLGHTNIVIFICVFVLSFTRLNGIGFATNIGSVWSKPLISGIFLSLRFITMFKMVVAVLRCGIKNRKYQLSENKMEFIPNTSMNIHEYDDRIKLLIEKLNNKCIICYDKLLDNECEQEEICQDEDEDEDDKRSKNLILSCDHVFHSECFKEWYLGSDDCPYCRNKVSL